MKEKKVVVMLSVLLAVVVWAISACVPTPEPEQATEVRANLAQTIQKIQAKEMVPVVVVTTENNLQAEPVGKVFPGPTVEQRLAVQTSLSEGWFDAGWVLTGATHPKGDPLIFPGFEAVELLGLPGRGFAVWTENQTAKSSEIIQAVFIPVGSALPLSFGSNPPRPMIKYEGDGEFCPNSRWVNNHWEITAFWSGPDEEARLVKIWGYEDESLGGLVINKMGVETPPHEKFLRTKRSLRLTPPDSDSCFYR